MDGGGGLQERKILCVLLTVFFHFEKILLGGGIRRPRNKRDYWNKDDCIRKAK
jgi:hypothetical protein